MELYVNYNIEVILPKITNFIEHWKNKKPKYFFYYQPSRFILKLIKIKQMKSENNKELKKNWTNLIKIYKLPVK